MGLKIENFTDDGICIGRTMLGSFMHAYRTARWGTGVWERPLFSSV